MSFEKKLYEYEVMPPGKVWDKLSAALDDLQLENHFKKKLEAITTQPPFTSWEKIEKNLSSDIADTVPAKLYDLAEAPPSKVWDRIDDQLVEDDFNKKFSEHLATLEVTPPIGNWRKIVASIGKETPVISFTKRYAKPLRYAAAAVVIGLIALAGFVFFNNSKDPSIAEAATKKEAEQKRLDNPGQNQVNNLQPNTSAVSVESDQIADVLPKKHERVPAHKPVKNEYTLASARNTVLDVHSGSEEIVADANSLQSNKKAELNNANNDNSPRYLVYLNDKGSMMKISKKLADLTCLYSKDGEITQDALAKLDRMVCNDMVLCWQEKLALAPINFSFNPLEMADILK